MKDKELNRSKPFRVNVRLTQDEDNKVTKVARLLNRSKAKVLRDSFFRQVPTKVLMTQEQFDKYISEYNRLGNNINQIAKKINSGEALLNNSFDEFRDDMRMLLNYIKGFNGLR